jgi:hypothetical protein
MQDLTPSQKGAVAEAEVAAAAIRLGVVVLRPLCEGARYDLAFDLGSRLLRVQCKWASKQRGVVVARARTSRHTPQGYVRRGYTAVEIDAVAAFSPETDTCYLIPVELVERRAGISLRITPTLNNQARRIRWAQEFELARSLRAHWSFTLDTLPPQDGQRRRR